MDQAPRKSNISASAFTAVNYKFYISNCLIAITQYWIILKPLTITKNISKFEEKFSVHQSLVSWEASVLVKIKVKRWPTIQVIKWDLQPQCCEYMLCLLAHWAVRTPQMVFYLWSHWEPVLSWQSLSSLEVHLLPQLIVVCDWDWPALSSIYWFPLHEDQSDRGEWGARHRGMEWEREGKARRKMKNAAASVETD